MREDDWDLVIDTNLKGPWLCCRAVAEPMKRQKWGRVINVSSMLGEISMPDRTPYASSKGGLTLLTQDAGPGVGPRTGSTSTPSAPGHSPPRSTRRS